MDWSFLKLDMRVITLLQNVTVLILLQITEHLMEHLFTCPCNEYRILFVRLFFIAPALAFAAFTFYLQQGTSFKEQVSTALQRCNRECCMSTAYNILRCIFCPCFELQNWFRCLKVLLQPAYIASCWTVILLIDGRYLACVHYSKCNNTMTTADMTDPEMVENMTYSKVVGFGIVLFFASAYLALGVGVYMRQPAEEYSCLLGEDRPAAGEADGEGGAGNVTGLQVDDSLEPHLQTQKLF